MGTDTTVSLIMDDRKKSERLAKQTFSVINTYETLFSRFLSDSELSILNRTGSHIVCEEFIDVLECSLELSRLTKGGFNPLVQVSKLGYRQNFSEINNHGSEIEDAIYDIDVNKIRIDKETRKVTLGISQKLDMGGVLKGYLASKLADEIMSDNNDCHGCIINIGGDLATRGLDELHEPFIFLLYNPITGEETALPLTDTSLSTSGTYARVWQTNHGKKHHIVDGLSRKNPETDLTSVSINHHDGSMSEALTKLFLVHGLKQALKIVPPTIFNYQYFCVSNDGKISSNMV